jgi:3-oxoacyl-[acyl-carrier protein] reductase
MDLGIAGKKAIICASSRGLGKGCALALAEAGCEMVINGRDEAVLDQTAMEIADRYGVPVTPVAADVSAPDGRNALLAACPDPDILVNNNGGPPQRDFRELDPEAIFAGVNQNMVAPIELIKRVIDGMMDRRFGRIVNITSRTVYMPVPGLDLSSGARAGLTAFLAGVSRQVAENNVTINNLLPGKMDTDRLRSVIKYMAKKSGTSEPAEEERQVREVPAKRFGRYEEFGQACAFLCSSHAGYITGQNLLIDGGLFPSAF